MTLWPDMNDEEKKKMWNEIADYLAIPEDERMPATNKELYESYQLPERTFYDKLRNEDFMRLVVKKSLIGAKKYFPKVLSILQKNIDKGNEKSIEMFIKYVGELADKIDHTSGGEKIGMNKEEKNKLDAILYGTNKPTSDGQSDTGDSARESVPVQ